MFCVTIKMIHITNKLFESIFPVEYMFNISLFLILTSFIEIGFSHYETYPFKHMFFQVLAVA